MAEMYVGICKQHGRSAVIDGVRCHECLVEDQAAQIRKFVVQVQFLEEDNKRLIGVACELEGEIQERHECLAYHTDLKDEDHGHVCDYCRELI